MAIAVQSLVKRFGSFTALSGIDLSVGDGELVALLGPSGSGKTTLLRIIAGLDWPDGGDVLFDGVSAVAQGARERQVGFVFQHYALFRHMTVFENVAFGLRVKSRRERPSTQEIQARVDQLLHLVQIDRLADRYPSQLSGGQRQRVALARALAIRPRMLLLDEPFGALDAKVRKELRRWLRRLHDELSMTSIFVTHDQEEALELADRVVVMGQGKIEQVGTPADVYDHPASPFVYQFLGHVNKLTCRIVDGVLMSDGIDLHGVNPPPGNAKDATLFVRPHEIDIMPVAGAQAIVRFISQIGPLARIEVEVRPGNPPIEVEMPRDLYHAVGLYVGCPVGLRLRRHHRAQPATA